MSAPLRDGAWVRLEGVNMRVVAVRAAEVVLCDPTGAGSTRCLHLSEACTLLKEGKLVVPEGNARSILGYADRDVAEMVRRRAYCQACDTLFARHRGEPGWANRPKEGYAKIAELTAERLHAAKARALGKNSREIAFEAAPSGSTLRGWYLDWVASNRNDNTLIPKHYNKGTSGSRLSEKTRKIVKEAVQTVFLTMERPDISTVHDHVRNQINLAREKAGKSKKRLADLAEPHVETLRRFIGRTITDYDRTMRREGPKAASALHRHGRPIVDIPLAEAELDSTPLNLFVVLEPGDYGYDHARGEGGEKQVARPNLTAVIDVATRMVLGFYIGLEAPSSSSVINCFLHAIHPKDVTGCHASAVWPAQGAPALLRYDGGAENAVFNKDDVKALLDMTAMKCPKGHPEDKGHIERFLKTANHSFTGCLPGKTFSNSKDRGEYDAAAQAQLNIADVRSRFLHWIVDYYHNRPHRGKGMLKCTPLRAWERSSQILRAPPNVSEDDLIASMSELIHSEITDKGIECFGLSFECDELMRLRDRFQRENFARPCRQTIKIRLDPRNLREVMVLEPGGTTWLHVLKSASNPRIADKLNLAQWKAHRDAVKREGAPTPAEEAASAAAIAAISAGTIKHVTNKNKKRRSNIDTSAVKYAIDII